MSLSRKSILILLTGIIILLLTGCGPKPPVRYQQLTIQDSEEARGWDIYLYVAVEPGQPSGDIESLLEWFRDVKFPESNRIKIFVWDNPQSALTNSMGDMIATLTVDREAGIDEIEIHPG